MNYDYEPFTVAYDIGDLPGFTASNTLTAPTDLRIRADYTSVSATWSKVDGADRYLVSITSDPSVSIQQQTTSTDIYIDNLKQGTGYKMTVVALVGGIKSPETSQYFQTLTPQSPPPPSPSPSPVDHCHNCTDDDSCTSCTGKPFCTNGTCQICNPNGLITTDSDCYQRGYVCVMNDNESGCEKCTDSEKCKLNYGDEYSCNMSTGKCEKTPVSPSSTNWGPIVGLIIGIIVLVILTGLLIFSLMHKSTKPLPFPEIL